MMGKAAPTDSTITAPRGLLAQPDHNPQKSPDISASKLVNTLRHRVFWLVVGS